jgi:DNA repair protein RadC
MMQINALSPVAPVPPTGRAPWIRLIREPNLTTEFSPSRRRLIATPRDAAQLVGPRLRLDEQEVFAVISLDIQHRAIAISEVSRGTANMAPVTVRGTFRLAIALGAHGIILVHNHPSNIPTPSNDDMNLTRALVEAGRIIDIPVQDHIIIGGETYFSFSESGLL